MTDESEAAEIKEWRKLGQKLYDDLPSDIQCMVDPVIEKLRDEKFIEGPLDLGLDRVQILVTMPSPAIREEFEKGVASGQIDRNACFPRS